MSARPHGGGRARPGVNSLRSVQTTWRRFTDWWRTHPLLADSSTAAVLIGFGILSVLSQYEVADAADFELGMPMWIALCWIVAAIAPFALRRRFPVFAFVAAIGLFIALRWWDVPEPFVTAVVFVLATAAVGIHGRPVARTRWRVAAGAAIAAEFVAIIVRDDVRYGISSAYTTTIVFQLLQTVAVYLAACMLGESYRQRIERETDLRQRTDELVIERNLRARQAVVEERVRIARELHDVLAHHVSVMGVQAGAARRVIDRRPDQAVAALSTIESSSRQAIDDLRRLVGLLRADGDGELIGPQPGLGELDDLVADAARGGVPAELRVDGDPATVLPTVQLATYRIVQEALTNVRKHACGATRADVAVIVGPETVEVRIGDDGRPAPPDSALTPGGGHGLLGMRERVAAHGGTLSAGAAGDGWVVHAVLPLRAQR